MNVRQRLMEYFQDENVVQPTSDLIALHKQGQLCRSRLDRFGRALAAEMNGEFQPGPLKSLTRCFEKVAMKYDGDATRLHDIARGAIRVDDVAQVFAADRILNPTRLSPFLSKMGDLGYYVRDFENKFESPSKAGFRSIDVKLQVPLSHGSYHIAEIQILHRGMEDAYAQTHEIMEAQRKMDLMDPNQRDEGNVEMFSAKLAANFAAVTDLRRSIHDEAARKLGLEIVERPKSVNAYAPKFDRAA